MSEKSSGGHMVGGGCEGFGGVGFEAWGFEVLGDVHRDFGLGEVEVRLARFGGLVVQGM